MAIDINMILWVVQVAATTEQQQQHMLYLFVIHSCQ